VLLTRQGQSDPAPREFLREYVERLASRPDIRSLALADKLPLGFGVQVRGISIDGYSPPPGENEISVDYAAVDSGYFRTLGIPIVRGRAFDGADGATAPRVAAVSEAMALRYWGTRDVLVEGNHIHDFPCDESIDTHGSAISIRAGDITIRGNIMHDGFSSSGMMFYADTPGPKSNVTIENNLVYDTKTGSLHQHYGRENVIRNNILCLSREHQLKQEQTPIDIDNLEFGKAQVPIHFFARGKIIKRYQYRKLYATETSSYITLEEIAELIRKGQELKVIDKVTGEDLTSITFSQIIFEKGRANHQILPINALKKIIQAGGESIAEIFEIGFSGIPKKIDEQLNEIMSRLTVIKEMETDMKKMSQKLQELEKEVKHRKPG
jgi:polyhydroxyalkanoate synthesis repressor PhaR